MITRYLNSITPVLLLSLLLCACNSDATNTETASQTEIADEPVEAEIAEVPQPDAVSESLPTIAEYAARNKDLTTFLKAFRQSGLDETLNSTGPYTVFVPSNEAFKALPSGTLEDLMNPQNKERLAEIINNHLVAGKLDTSALQEGSKIKTLGNGQLDVLAADEHVMINGASIEKENIACSNGIIHVIDKVLLPAKESI